MQKALIYKIDRLNNHNGPGFRTVIYFKGCPLHCSWCHNPEGISSSPEVWFNASKCIACGICVTECSENALRLTTKDISIDREKCTGCQHCTSVCPTKAIEPIGELYTVDELFKVILQDKILFDSSGGGVTVTGGEPGLYPAFIGQLFKLCTEENIHTAFDTSGAIGTKPLEELIPFTNTIFFDIKLLEEKGLKLHTGMSLKQFNITVDWLQFQKDKNPELKVEFRTPLVPEVTDTEDNLHQIAKFISTSFPNSEWELCLFNDLCEDKYLKMNRSWIFTNRKHKREDYKRFLLLQGNYPKIKILVSGFVEA